MEHRQGNPLYKTACTHKKCTQRAFCSGRSINLRSQSHQATLHPKVQHPLGKSKLAHAAVVARCGCKSQKSGNMQHCTCKGQQRARSETKLGCTRWQKSRQDFGIILLRARGGSKRSHSAKLESAYRAPPGRLLSPQPPHHPPAEPSARPHLRRGVHRAVAAY